MFTRNLIGNCAGSAFRLHDTKERIGIWFVMQDLSVRTEGSFRYVIAVWAASFPLSSDPLAGSDSPLSMSNPRPTRRVMPLSRQAGRRFWLQYSAMSSRSTQPRSFQVYAIVQISASASQPRALRSRSEKKAARQAEVMTMTTTSRGVEVSHHSALYRVSSLLRGLHVTPSSLRQN